MIYLATVVFKEYKCIFKLNESHDFYTCQNHSKSSSYLPAL